MSARALRIRDEAMRYGAEVNVGAPPMVAAGVYAFGIEMGLAIAVAAEADPAGSDAATVLAELRALVYHGEPDRWLLEAMDRTARTIVEGS